MNARVLWPNSITFTKDSKITAKCFCTLRRTWKNFRVDRMLTCHALTTPDDIEPADDEPRGDFEDSIAGRDYRALA
jgi:predicted DNA-binding transcriptional regulator YafY